MPSLARIVGIIFRPQAEWEVIASERTSIDLLIRRYIVPLALLAPIATVIGMKTFDASWDARAGYLVPPADIYAAGVATLFTTIVSIFALAGIFKLIAPMYGRAPDYLAGLKVATYGAIPVMVAGVTLVLPVMVIVSVVALCHTLYLYWLGVHRVLGIAAEAQTEFLGVSMTLLGLASVLAGGTASSLGLF